MILQALALDRNGSGQRILKSITPVRKRAGKVRDMDVLIELAAGLDIAKDAECCKVQLLEYLGHKRFAKARKLRKSAGKHRRTAAPELRECASFIGRKLGRQGKRSAWSPDAAATALRLSGEIRKWSKLTGRNLHSFRLKAKDLRDVLQLSTANITLVKVLKDLTDAIGAWHDWSELEVMADDVLQHAGRCEMRAKLHARVEEQLSQAVSLSNQVRRRHFGRGSSPDARQANSQGQAAIKAAAKLAA
jgi:CHAD domain-containing protein